MAAALARGIAHIGGIADGRSNMAERWARGIAARSASKTSTLRARQLTDSAPIMHTEFLQRGSAVHQTEPSSEPRSNLNQRRQPAHSETL
jgi:hypothetical protein